MKHQKQCVCTHRVWNWHKAFFLSCFHVRFEKEKKNFHTHRSHLIRLFLSVPVTEVENKIKRDQDFNCFTT